MKGWVSKHKKILVIMSAALLLRLVFFFFSSPWSAGSFDRLVIEDGREYYDLAMSLLNNHSFNSNLLRTPGQPLIIAALFTVFGRHFTLLFALQIILNVLSILVIYFLIKELLLPYFKPEEAEQFALVSCALYAVELHVIYFTAASYYSDINFSFFVYCAMLLFLKGVRENRLGLFAWAGAFAGVSTLIKPTGQYLPLLFPVFYLYAAGGQRGIIPKLKSYTVFLLAFMLILSPWIYRNYKRFGAVIYSSSGNVNIHLNALNLHYYYEKKPLEEYSRLLENEGYSAAPDNYRKSLIEKKVAVAYIKANFKDYARFYATNIARIYFNMSSTHICNALGLENIIKTTYGITQFNNPVYAVTWFLQNKTKWEIMFGAYVLVFLLLVYAGAVVGFIRLLAGRQYRLAAVAVVFISYFTFIPCPSGQSRYKFPMMPYYMMFFAVGAGRIFSKGSSGSLTRGPGENHPS